MYGTLHGKTYEEEDAFGKMAITIIRTFYLGEQTSRTIENVHIGDDTFGGEGDSMVTKDVYPLSKKAKRKLRKKWLKEEIADVRKNHKESPNGYNDNRDRSMCLRATGSDKA